MEELNDLLNYNNLKIFQNKEWFKFSIDSVLLASTISMRLRTKKILDICSGNAPIPLILSTRTKAKIDAVEIQKDIYDLAIKSVEINKLNNQITMYNEDIKQFAKIRESDSYDLITCNPPYFKMNSKSLSNINEHKAIARHEMYINMNELAIIAKKLLKNNGIFAIVQRTFRLVEIIDLMKKNNLEPKSLKLVYSNVRSKSELFILECMKNGKEGLIIEPPLIIYNTDGSYSEQMVNLLGRSDMDESKKL